MQGRLATRQRQLLDGARVWVRGSGQGRRGARELQQQQQQVLDGAERLPPPAAQERP